MDQVGEVAMSTAVFARLGWRGWLYLALTVVVGRAWVQFDQDWLPQRLLMPAFLLLVLALLAGAFAWLRPQAPSALARTIALVLGLVVGVLIVVQHVILTFDVTYKAGIILVATVALPFVAARGYRWVSTRS
jgi:hypothetical protein